MISNGKKDISQQDIDAVVDVLKSDFLTQAPPIPLSKKKYFEIFITAEGALAKKMTKGV